MSTSQIDSTRAYHGWFQLSPRPREAQGVLQDKMELGTMRLSVSYSQDRIFPLEMYKPLQGLLVQTLEVLVRQSYYVLVLFLDTFCYAYVHAVQIDYISSVAALVSESNGC